jgi:hypothetical protein
MEIDVSNFFKTNVIDTCAIWHVLSSKKLVRATKNTGCHFAATEFVYYEALHKTRKSPKKEDLDLQDYLRKERVSGFFGNCSLDISDLQDVGVLDKRMRLGKGELSSIVFAKKAGLAFMTDDQKARKLGQSVIARNRIQTTPHLFGWLFFSGNLTDSDKEALISEHEKCGGRLRPYFEAAYHEALRCRLMSRTSPRTNDTS